MALTLVSPEMRYDVLAPVVIIMHSMHVSLGRQVTQRRRRGHERCLHCYLTMLQQRQSDKPLAFFLLLLSTHQPCSLPYRDIYIAS
jgi:hypothetical protein